MRDQLGMPRRSRTRYYYYCSNGPVIPGVCEGSTYLPLGCEQLLLIVDWGLPRKLRTRYQAEFSMKPSMSPLLSCPGERNWYDYDYDYDYNMAPPRGRPCGANLGSMGRNTGTWSIRSECLSNITSWSRRKGIKNTTLPFVPE